MLDGAKDEDPFKQQDDDFFKLHDLLEAHTKPKNWTDILEENEQAVPTAISEASFGYF